MTLYYSTFYFSKSSSFRWKFEVSWRFLAFLFNFSCVKKPLGWDQNSNFRFLFRLNENFEILLKLSKQANNESFMWDQVRITIRFVISQQTCTDESFLPKNSVRGWGHLGKKGYGDVPLVRVPFWASENLWQGPKITKFQKVCLTGSTFC